MGEAAQRLMEVWYAETNEQEHGEMMAYRLAETAVMRGPIIELREHGVVKLESDDGEPIGFLLSRDEFELLSAAAALASDPQRLESLLEENRRFQAGEDGEIMSSEEFNLALR
jgi:PHD/YefM family antitoxin component YafN of YafNO toxin-antitoxin module